MKSKSEHIIREELNNYYPEPVLNKLQAFCSSYSLFKSDEELRNSFDSFFVGNRGSMVNADREQLLNEFNSREGLLPLLDELGEQLAVENDQHEAKEVSQTDSSNRLYASLKRHPE